MKKEKCDYPFIRFPRALVESPLFMNISIEARTLLAMILDRSELSAINSERFTDENGGIYVIYTVEEICEKLGCSITRTMRIFKELENGGLITRKRKNRLSPYRIYITDTFYDLINRELTTLQNTNSRHNEIKPHEVTKRKVNKNNNINNDNSNTHSSIKESVRTEDEIREQIEYDCIVCDSNRRLIDEIVMIISDIFNGTSPTVRIGKDDMPRSVVISRFCKLDAEHVLFVASQLENNTQNIRNIKSYIVTLLYNAPATMESTVTAEFAYHNRKVS